jgi:microcystin-dependent protein
MDKNIIIFSLISILFMTIIYLFYKVNQIKDSIEDRNTPTNPPVVNPNINLDNYYTKNDIDNNFSTKTYVDNNIQNSISTISTDQNGNIFRTTGNQELGYDIEIDDTITFNHPVTFKENINFDNPINFNNQVDFHNNLNIDHDNNNLINSLPPRSIIAWNDNNAPKGWALCDGQSYNLDSNGDAQVDSTGVQTPDLRGRFILGAGDGDSLTNRVLGETDGDENITLTINQIPQHHHYISYALEGTWSINRAQNKKVMSRYPGVNGFGTGIDYWVGDESLSDYWVGASSKMFDTECASDISNESQCTMHDDTLPHNNMPPYYVLTYIMKL